MFKKIKGLYRPGIEPEPDAYWVLEFTVFGNLYVKLVRANGSLIQSICYIKKESGTLVRCKIDPAVAECYGLTLDSYGFLDID